MQLLSTLFLSGTPAFLPPILLFLLLSPFLASAAGPLPRSRPSRATAEWTITSMQRTCNTADAACAWSFGVSRDDGSAATPCAFAVLSSSEGTVTASESPATNVACGAYTVSSGWSGQFGAGEGFTTPTVFDAATGLAVFPAYKDAQLAGGAVVVPDQSYEPVAWEKAGSERKTERWEEG